MYALILVPIFYILREIIVSTKTFQGFSYTMYIHYLNKGIWNTRPSKRHVVNKFHNELTPNSC